MTFYKIIEKQILLILWSGLNYLFYSVDNFLISGQGCLSIWPAAEGRRIIGAILGSFESVLAILRGLLI